MKKLIAMVLVLTLVLSMGAFAFAVEGQPSKKYEDESQVTIKKELKINNTGTVNPAETFEFKIEEGTGKRDGKTITAPPFTTNIFEITVAEGGISGTANIILPTFPQVGVYTYPITETTGTTAGIIYDGSEKSLVVTVINNPEGNGFLRVLTMTTRDKNGKPIKVDSFKNEYSAGDLTVNKEIAGNYADPNDEFEITVTVTPEAGKVINAATIVWNTAAEKVTANSDGSYTAVYTVNGGDRSSFTIKNLPYNVTYKVEEADSGVGYVATYENESGEFDKATITTTITNTRTINIETGINLDNLPYALILVGAAAGLVAFTIRRRPSSDE